MDSRKALVSWDNVCRTKVECGLSLVHLPTCNKLAMMKLLWVIHNKADKLWIKWLLCMGHACPSTCIFPFQENFEVSESFATTW